MFTSYRSGSSAYRQVAAETGVPGADPHELILMLFDAALAAIAGSQVQLTLGDRAAKCASIGKAIAIVDQGLRSSLDLSRGGELAARLSALYEYISRRLISANAHDDKEALEEAARLLKELRGAWAQIRPVTAGAAA